MNAPRGLADLVRIASALSDDALQAAEGALGVRYVPPLADDQAVSEPSTAAPGLAADSSKSTTERLAVPLWRVQSVQAAQWQPLDAAHHAAPRPQDEPATPITSAELCGSPTLPPTPPGPLLEPWSRTWPRIRDLLSEPRPTREVDTHQLVHRLARGAPLARVPRMKRRRWAEHVTVLLDEAPHLIALERAHACLLSLLQRMVGRRAITWHWFGLGEPLPRLSPRHLTLLLSDLGRFSPGDDSGHGRLLARSLARSLACLGTPARAFVPTPGLPLPGWTVQPWQRHQAAPDAMRRATDELLTLVVTARHVDWGLWRAVRMALRPTQTDVRVDLLLASHPDVERTGPWGFCLREAALDRRRMALRKRFEQGEADRGTPLWAELRFMVGMVERWHAGFRPELRALETLAAMGHPATRPHVSDARADEAVTYVQRMAATEGALAGAEDWEHFVEFCDRTLDWLPGEARRHERIGNYLNRVARFSSAEEPIRRVPPGIAPEETIPPPPPGPPPPGPDQVWMVLQGPSGLEVQRLDSPRSIADLPRGYSRLVTFALSEPWLIVTGERLSRPLVVSLEAVEREPQPISIAPGSAPITLATDRTKVTIDAWRWPTGGEPHWAVDAGRDRVGLWAEVAVEAEPEQRGGRPRRVRQRLRWIAPGYFNMGSPRDEPGRYSKEGPPHRVHISSGFWMADTPCTQALWTAVMGDNPSRFSFAQRPVEQVSHEQVTRFLQRLGEKWGATGGCVWRLPTEAEWEYACRAGTVAATYAGPLWMRGAADAPVLHPIAWYRGNSGVDFDDPADADDSSNWPDKQFEHSRAASRIVKEKAPNAFGLHDTLGNVWEWCADGWREYGAETVTDPWGAEPGPDQPAAVRGGSWASEAHFVRAASRDWDPVGYADRFLGFRFALAPPRPPEGS